MAQVRQLRTRSESKLPVADQANRSGDPSSVRGSIDTTYQTQQRDMFSSGLAGEIGGSAFLIWNAIKFHSDFQTGESWPGIRRIAAITKTSDKTVQSALKTLVAWRLLRITKRGQRNVYVARERIDVRVGDRVVATVVIDYVPSAMRERLQALKDAGEGDLGKQDVWAQVDLIPGPGMVLDAAREAFSGNLRADEVPDQVALPPHESVKDARQNLKALADQMRAPKK